MGNLSFSLPVSPITFDSAIKCVGGVGLSLGALDLSGKRLATARDAAVAKLFILS